MKRRIIILVFTFVLLIAGSFIFFTYKSKPSKTNVDLVVKKLVKLNPKATIRSIELGQGIINPDKVISVTIGEEKVFIYEFKDEKSTEEAFTLLTDGSPGEDLIADFKGNIAIKYSGHDKKIIQQFKGLLD